MMKNLLFLTFILFFTSMLFAQEVSKKQVIAPLDQNQVSKTIEKVSAYPNPFTYTSKISFISKISQNIYFEVKNVLGKSVYKFHFTAEVGQNEILFHRNNLLSGMYLYTLQTDSEVISKRLVVK